MSSGLNVLLRRIALVVASPLLLVTAIAIVVLGTEFGTRWTLRQVLRFAPGELLVPEFNGTFLRGLDVPRLQYSDETMLLTASDVYIGIDWLRSSPNRAQLQRLSAGEIAYRSFAKSETPAEPLEIAMPPLAFGIGAANIRIGSLLLRDRIITDIVIENFNVRGNRFAAESASASMDAIALTARQLSARLEGDVTAAATFAWQYDQGEWSGEGRIRGSLAELEFEHRLAGAYAASASGKLLLLHRVDPEFDARVSFAQWDFGTVVASAGNIGITGTASAYRAALTFDIRQGSSLSAAITADVTGNLSGLDSIDLRARGPAGELDARGNLVWLPEFGTELTLEGRELDPSLVSRLASGKLNANLALQASGTEEFILRIDSVDGSYNGEPARAEGRLARNRDDWRCAACTVSLGPNRVAADGELSSKRLSAAINADAPDLRMLWPGLSGALTANAQIRGSLAQPVVSGRASGTGISWSGWSAAALSLASESSTRKNVDLVIGVDGLSESKSLLGSGTAELRGSIDALDTDLQWSRGEVAASLRAVVAAGEDTVSALVRSASLSEPFAGAWELSGPARFSFGPGALGVDAHAWRNGDAALEVSGLSLRQGRLETSAKLVAMPLTALNVALPGNVRLQGFVDAAFQVVRAPDGTLAGGLDWSQRDTVVRITSPSAAVIDIPVPVATAELTLVGTGLEGQLRLEVDPGVQGSLDLALERLSADSAVTARLRLSGSDWDWVSALFPEIDNFRGTITSDVGATGKLASPELSGELRWREGTLAIPSLNIPLTSIDVTATGSSAGSAAITGSAKAGNGTLGIEGRFEDLLQSSRSFNLRLNGREATLLNWPDYQLAASPDMVFTGGDAGVRASGSIKVDRAEISVTELPEGAVSPSADVSVAGREEEAKEIVPVGGEVDVILSESVHISAFGLDTKVTGQLKFTLPEKREPRANGTLKLVDGVFTAYGQRLTIEEGTMTFTGPLDDPVIYVRAVREIEGLSGTIKAGIELRGRAQNLSSSVFSSPTMSEADALSYLVLGRPLEDATAADGSVLSGTAIALGLRQAAGITNQIGQTLGLDQLSVAGNNQSTAALVAGKQISPKLYVRYAYGVFSQVGNLLLRYKLSKRLTIEAGTGESQSMDLLYIVEKP